MNKNPIQNIKKQLSSILKFTIFSSENDQDKHEKYLKELGKTQSEIIKEVNYKNTKEVIIDYSALKFLYENDPATLNKLTKAKEFKKENILIINKEEMIKRGKLKEWNKLITLVEKIGYKYLEKEFDNPISQLEV